MTRSFVAIVRGDWRLAIEYHLFGPLLFGCLIVTLAHWIWELKSGRRHQTFYSNWFINPRIQLAIAIGFLGYYLLRLNSLLPTAQL
jgi:Protein of unknown function (DUF2752)